MNYSLLFLAGSLLLGGCVSMGKRNEIVEVKKLPDYHIAYVEYTGDYEANGEIYDIVLQPLIDWAVEKNLWQFPEKTKLFIIYLDENNEKKMRMAITIPEETKTPDFIHTMTLKSGNFAVGSFELAENEFGKAWGFLYSWIAEHGYSPAEGFCFEIKNNDSDEHPEKKHLVDICIPVEKIN